MTEDWEYPLEEHVQLVRLLYKEAQVRGGNPNVTVWDLVTRVLDSAPSDAIELKYVVMLRDVFAPD